MNKKFDKYIKQYIGKKNKQKKTLISESFIDGIMASTSINATNTSINTNWLLPTINTTGNNNNTWLTTTSNIISSSSNDVNYYPDKILDYNIKIINGNKIQKRLETIFEPSDDGVFFPCE